MNNKIDAIESQIRFAKRAGSTRYLEAADQLRALTDRLEKCPNCDNMVTPVILQRICPECNYDKI